MQQPHTDLPPPDPVTVATANPIPNINHPPYADMITAAIVAMKEKDGSSRQAIGKYIERAYPSLSPTHDSLLTQQLKKMKNSGQLVMVKHSYALPGSGLTVPDGPKRRPGRPPKARPDVQANEPAGGVQGGPDAGASWFDPIGAVPTMVPIGEVVDGPAKRRPGRPPKAVAVASSVAASGVIDAQPVRSIVSVNSVVKRRPGRPPKVNGDATVGVSVGGPAVVKGDETVGVSVGGPALVKGDATVGVSVGGPALVKRGRGRPVSVFVGNGVMKRGRGRPPRAIGQIRRGRPRKGAGGTVGRPRGRSPKNAAVNYGSAAPANGAVLPVNQAGRPPKMGEAKRPRKLGGKPLGRPKKNTSVAAMQSSEQQQLIAYEELKGRVEHFQSRIKQAVSVVKPYLNYENAVIAVGALQELEELSSMDIITPITAQSAPTTVEAAPVAVQSQSAPGHVQNAPALIQSVPAPPQSARVSFQGPPGYAQNAPGYVQGANANEPGYSQGGYIQGAPGYVYVQNPPESVQKPMTFQGQDHFFHN